MEISRGFVMPRFGDKAHPYILQEVFSSLLAFTRRVCVTSVDERTHGKDKNSVSACTYGCNPPAQSPTVHCANTPALPLYGFRLCPGCGVATVHPNLKFSNMGKERYVTPRRCWINA